MQTFRKCLHPRTMFMMLDFETSVEEVKAKLARGENFILLDVREPWEVATASIIGTVHIPMGEIPSRASNELDPDSAIVVLCHHGVRSLNVTVWLRSQGYENVQSMAGGIDLWSRAVDPRVPLY